MEQTVKVHNLGMIGVVSDQPGHTLPPEAWTDCLNVRFDKKGITPFKGRAQAFGTPTIAPGFVMNVPSAGDSFWIYTNLVAAYVYNSSAHTKITRQSAGVDVPYTAVNLRDWQGSLLGGVPILNNGADVPQFWSTVNPSSKLANLTNWPSTLRAKVLRPFGRFLVAMNLNDNSVLYPHAFQWSHEAEPGAIPTSWDYTDPTVDAGRLELTDVSGGAIRDGLMLGNAFVVYKETSTHIVRYVGGQNIMSPDLLLASSGIMAARCVSPIREGTQHFVVTEDDIIVHSGVKDAQSVAEDRTRELIFDQIDVTNRANSFTVHNSKRKEVILAYPGIGSTYPNKCAVYDYMRDTWSYGDWVGTSADVGIASTSVFPAWSDISEPWSQIDQPWSSNDGRAIITSDYSNTMLLQVDVGDTFTPAAGAAFIERQGLAMVGRDRQGQPKVDFSVGKQVNRIWPKISGSAIVKIQVGAQDDPDDTIEWSTPYEFNPSTDRWVDLDPPVSGKLIAIRLQSVTDGQWRFEGYDLDMALLGNI